MKKRVLVASNRGPVSYQFGEDGTVTSRRGGGGLVSGVSEALATMAPAADVTWICAALSDADRAVARQLAASPGKPLEPGDVPVRMLDIPPETFDRAYNNVANSVLWFVQHLLFDTPNQPRFGREFRRDWAAYLAYNEAFADAMAEEAQGDGAAPGELRALIQDYHLSLAPRLLRDRLSGWHPHVGIAHFSHTPWAPPDYYRMLPAEVAEAVLDGMLGATRSASTPAGGPPRSWTAARRSWAPRSAGTATCGPAWPGRSSTAGTSPRSPWTRWGWTLPRCGPGPRPRTCGPTSRASARSPAAGS